MAQTTWKQVVYDVADAFREANGTTAKIAIGDLPNKVKEGGENIDTELTTLESTLQEILEVLPFKGFQNSGQYVWKKLTAEGGDLVEFVISNDSTAYPNGGMQDGYWYELAGVLEFGVEFANVLGLTKFAVDTFSFSSNTRVDAKLNYSLGTIPKFALILAKDTVTEQGCIMAYICASMVNVSNGLINCGVMLCYNSATTQHVASNASGFDVTSTQIWIDPTGYYYQAGVEYVVITGV